MDGLSLQKYLTDVECSDRYAFSKRHWRRLVDGGFAPPPVEFLRLRRWSIATLDQWDADGCPRVRLIRRKGGPS